MSPRPPPPLRLRLFGAPRFDAGDAPGVEPATPDAMARGLPNERRSQLVAWLALKRTWVGRAELAALLWPGHAGHLAAANLRKAVHRVQSAPWAGGLEASGHALRFTAGTDVHDFETALAEGRLADALALFGGELMAGFDDPANEAWTERLRFERERLQGAWRAAALEWLARPEAGAVGAADGEPHAALVLAERLLAADPLDEAAVMAQLRLLAHGGRVGAARAAYRAYAERLQAELGIAPGQALRALHDELGTAVPSPAGGGSDTTGPTHSPTPSGTHSPASATSVTSSATTDSAFVGRATELQRIAELLAQGDCAVLCLVGPGGVGKTRLARQAMQRLAPGFADGAAFVPLEDVASTPEVGARLASALGVALDGKSAPLAQVQRALAGRQLLLVLDNLEQLAAEAAWLDELVHEAPRLKLIVTSRVRPVARAPWMLALEGLPCPEPEDGDRLEAFDAARLFVNAARRAEPALLPAAEAAAIVEICRLVEGLPLALELAASFTRVLSCEAIATELREGTDLLRAADPARPARQASIEAVFAQSWRHLAEAERDSLARLALFRGGFTAAAARRVAGASLPVLASLSDKSLLRKDGARCHVHPLLQQFALQRLGEGPRREATAAAHSEHFLRQLAEARGALAAARREAMQAVDTELENHRAAWCWAAAHGPAAHLGGAALAWMAYCDHRGRWREGLGLLEEALAGASAAADARAAAALGAAAAHLEHRLDRYAEAEARAHRCLEPARRAGDTATEIQCTKVLAATCLRLGRLPEARRWYQRTLKRAEETADALTATGTLDNLSLVERQLGRLDDALDLSRRALLRHRELADAAGEALCLNNQGVLFVLRGELDAARAALRAGQQLCERHGLPTTRAMIETNLADLADKAGDAEALVRHAQKALELSLATGQRATEVVAHQLLMVAARKRGDLPAARRELAASMRLALVIGRPALKVNGAYLLATLLAAQGDRGAAVQVMRFALEHPVIVGADRAEAEADIRAWSEGRADASPPPWRGPTLDELLERAALQADQAFAPLLAELQAAGT